MSHYNIEIDKAWCWFQCLNYRYKSDILVAYEKLHQCEHINIKYHNRVIDCCLTPSGQFFRYIMATTCYILTRWQHCLLSTRPICLLGFFFSSSSLKHKSAGRHVILLWHIILTDYQPISLCSYFLMMHA